MTDRAIPQSLQFENLVRDKVIEALTAADPNMVVKCSKGDHGPFTFDWLLRTHTTCIGLEVTRAEDTDQLNAIEDGLNRNGYATGTAPMPWDCVAEAVNKKLKKAPKYRSQLEEQDCGSSELHLGVTSWAQVDLFADAVSGPVWRELERALSLFDAVWLVDKDRCEVKRSP